MRLYTIGHSTRSLEDFIELLKAHGIRRLVDVRHFPGSRRYPHFNRETLAEVLPAQGIQYEHLLALGGRRRAKKDSPNIEWRNEAFRGYADYMATEEFRSGLEALKQGADKTPTAFMCSEAVWWRCHRSMISDALKAEGVEVVHIMGKNSLEEHPYTAVARLDNGRLSYAHGKKARPESPMKPRRRRSVSEEASRDLF